MRSRASQITSLTIVYSTVYSAGSKKTLKLRVNELCEGNSPVNGDFPYKWPATWKIFPFDDVIMIGTNPLSNCSFIEIKQDLDENEYKTDPG